MIEFDQLVQSSPHALPRGKPYCSAAEDAFWLQPIIEVIGNSAILTAKREGYFGRTD